MRATGRDGHFEQRHSLEVMGVRDPGDRAPRTARPRGHLLPVARIAADRLVDPTSRLDDAPDERHVLLLDFPVGELARQLLVRAIVLGDDHHA